MPRVPGVPKRSKAKQDRRPGLAHVPPTRRPKWGFGTILHLDHYPEHPFTGRVDAIYADYWAALDGFIVTNGWYEGQERPITGGKDQVFYSLVALDGDGSILAGETMLTEVPPPQTDQPWPKERR